MTRTSPPFVVHYAREIVHTLPEGSLYFGGTDAGRFLPTAFAKNHFTGEPFYILTQNALADHTYVDYLELLFGHALGIPDTQARQEAFDSYLQDAQERMKKGEVEPGENIEIQENGAVHISGRTAVMKLNGRLVRWILNRNADREAFLQESFPLLSLYPRLSPQGPILKIHPKDMVQLSGKVLQHDRAYWSDLVTKLLGRSFEKASVEQVCEFLKRVYVERELDGFEGHRNFVSGRWEVAPQTLYGHLRLGIARTYAWRAQNPSKVNDTDTMKEAALTAYKQAFALCPFDPQLVESYLQFLRELDRNDEADLVYRTARTINPELSIPEPSDQAPDSSKPE